MSIFGRKCRNIKGYREIWQLLTNGLAAIDHCAKMIIRLNFLY